MPLRAEEIRNTPTKNLPGLHVSVHYHVVVFFASAHLHKTLNLFLMLLLTMQRARNTKMIAADLAR